MLRSSSPLMRQTFRRSHAAPEHRTHLVLFFGLVADEIERVLEELELAIDANAFARLGIRAVKAQRLLALCLAGQRLVEEQPELCRLPRSRRMRCRPPPPR